MSETREPSEAMMRELAFMHRMKQDNGYWYLKPIENGRWAGLKSYLFTCAIETGRMHDLDTFEQRWCYHSKEAALAAIERWDGRGEPQGWHRNPVTGMRRTPGGKEYRDGTWPEPKDD